MSRTRFAVLASGSGSNLQVLLDDAAREDHPGQAAVVLSDVKDAYALQRARNAGIPAVHLPRRNPPDRRAWDADMARILKEHGAEWVAMAGFMRLVTTAFLDVFAGRVLNVHPALLPSFPGLHAAKQAIEARVRISGCTVHFADDGCDTGPIIAQAAVPVRPDDTEEALQRRIQRAEHVLFPEVLRWACAGELALDGRNVRLPADAVPWRWLGDGDARG